MLAERKICVAFLVLGFSFTQKSSACMCLGVPMCLSVWRRGRSDFSDSYCLVFPQKRGLNLPSAVSATVFSP